MSSEHTQDLSVSLSLILSSEYFEFWLNDAAVFPEPLPSCMESTVGSVAGRFFPSSRNDLSQAAIFTAMIAKNTKVIILFMEHPPYFVNQIYIA